MLWMGRKAGIVNLLNFRMLGQKVGNDAAILIVSFHSHGKSFCSAQYQKRIERRKDRTDPILHEFYPFRIGFVVQSDKSADAVGMSVEIFRRRMDNNVDTKINRLLKIGRHKRVVANDSRTACV